MGKVSRKCKRKTHGGQLGTGWSARRFVGQRLLASGRHHRRRSQANCGGGARSPKVMSAILWF